MLVLVVSQLSAQKLVIRLDNGNENIENLNSIQKLYFSGNGLVVDFISGTDDIYQISDVRKLYFDSSVSVDESPESPCQELTVYPNPAGDIILFKGMPDGGGKLSIYRMDGGLVLTKEISCQQELIDISGLPQGLYLLNLAGFTTKFIRQ
jgi:hypothetical protein